jgi:hypothetical protein
MGLLEKSSAKWWAGFEFGLVDTGLSLPVVGCVFIIPRFDFCLYIRQKAWGIHVFYTNPDYVLINAV